MEGSVLYQATLPYISSERIFFFKVISDIVGNTVLKEQAILPEQLLLPHIETILNFAINIQQVQICNSTKKTSLFTETEQALIKQIFSRLSFTETMALDFHRLITYAKLDHKLS